MKTKLIKRIPTLDWDKWIKAAQTLEHNAKGNVSEYIRRATNYAAKNKIKL